MKVQLEQNVNTTNAYMKRKSNEAAEIMSNAPHLSGLSSSPKNHVDGTGFGINKNFLSHAIFKGDNNFNSQINTTTNYNFSGRVSFSGDIKQETGIAFAEKVVKSKYFEKFCSLAQQNSAIAEALGALVITCIMRPLAIMAMPQKDVDKNRKAASHSIASGVTGYIFAKIAYEPFSAAMSRIKASYKTDKTKYIGEKGKWLLEAGIERVKNGMKKTVSYHDCYNQLITYGPKVITAPILALLTVSTMPYIDRYIIDKYILREQPKPDDKPVFTTYDHFKFITFKSTPKNDEVFKSFKGAMK